MNNKSLMHLINQIEGYKVGITNLHWSADNMSRHKLCDELFDVVKKNEDKMAELGQGLYGRIRVNDVKPIPYKVSSLSKLVKDLMYDVVDFSSKQDGVFDGGMKSIADDFVGDLGSYLYLNDLCDNE